MHSLTFKFDNFKVKPEHLDEMKTSEKGVQLKKLNNTARGDFPAKNKGREVPVTSRNAHKDIEFSVSDSQIKEQYNLNDTNRTIQPSNITNPIIYSQPMSPSRKFDDKLLRRSLATSNMPKRQKLRSTKKQGTKRSESPP